MSRLHDIKIGKAVPRLKVVKKAEYKYFVRDASLVPPEDAWPDDYPLIGFSHILEGFPKKGEPWLCCKICGEYLIGKGDLEEHLEDAVAYGHRVKHPCPGFTF
jgi:hypothetical protein